MSDFVRQMGLIRALLYRTFAVDDLEVEVDRVMKELVDREIFGANADEYLQAVQAVLASDIKLSELVSPGLSEQEIRLFLGAVQNRLQEKS